ncbi:MAG: thioredoxin [Lachnospiraceae bacterium]|nr:thioredoxin [Lachnospiraceae bacterium]
MSELKITNSNFKELVMESEQPVLIDFWAPWCMPCRMMSPIIEQLANEYEGKVKVGKVNVDEELELARAFNVMSIPMIALIKDGKVVNSVVGARPKSELEDMIK